MKKRLRILPILFLMTTLFACSKDKGTFTPPYLKGPDTTPKLDGGFTPPYLMENREWADAPVVDSTKNRDF